MTRFRAGAFALFLLAALGFPATARAQDPAGFVGAAFCAGCHASEAARWQGSHHALAMQKATPATVLGDFNSATFTAFGVPTTFSRSGDKFLVRTEGPDGYPHEYEVAWTFGVYPLQQYLISFPGGRLQALGIAWDSRPAAEGGQRWFHLYPDQRLRPRDRLHWTRADQTWNYQCADCHSTGLVKNFDLAANSYATAWSDVDVACEACHGPGAGHLAWAKSRPLNDPTKGLANPLRAADASTWEMNPDTGIARRTAPIASTELDTCAPCHSRRKPLVANPPVGGKLLDSYLPALLEPGLYFADGQIDGEVFEYGSFMQSAMHRAGVTCSNCHEPHGLKLRAEGNAVCAQCHLPARFDTAEHTHHAPGGAGAQCIACHMPTKTYMVVHTRHDHSLRVPRPDLSLAIGTPNACNSCHADKPPAWAAETVAAWFPAGRRTQPHFATALHAGRTGAADAERLLDQLILDATQPPIARASALPLLAGVATPASLPAFTAALADPSPLIRSAAPRALSPALSPAAARAALALLSDPVRAVRVEAARALAGTPRQAMDTAQAAALEAASRELVAAELVDADRPESHLNLGLLSLRAGKAAEAEAAYRTALRLDPDFVPALANLADLERLRGRDQVGADLLRRALQLEPGNAAVRHALGLLLVRQHNLSEALPLLREASGLAPDNARYAYVYGVALNASGAPAQAIAVLQQASRAHPTDRELLFALATISRDQGATAAALSYARALLALSPRDPQAGALVADLERRAR